jgi:hypothetical protein
MKIIVCCLIILSVIPSCFFLEHEPTKEEKQEVFEAVRFDNSVLHDQSAYTSVLNTVFGNFDSIGADNRNIHYSKKLDSVLDLIHTDKLEIFRENGDTVVRFDINRNKRQNRILECHFLYWHSASNFKHYDSFDFIKDTILNSNYVYRIGVAKDFSGW